MIERPESLTPAPATAPRAEHGGVHGAVWRTPFGGVLVALLLLAGVEAILHSDAFLYRYRSVFAAGRAMDKVLAFEAQPTAVLVLGNSRVDNGIFPEVLRRETGLEAFNLGLPGAEACNIEGIVARLERHGVFDKGRTAQVLIGLDDGILQRSSGMGYEVYFDDKARLLAHQRYGDWIRANLHLWGYADSLRSLQEPAKLTRFAEASIGEVQSWGGSARQTSGFRAADEVANQDAAQAATQGNTTRQPPDAQVVECLQGTVTRLQRVGVEVKFFFHVALIMVISRVFFRAESWDDAWTMFYVVLGMPALTDAPIHYRSFQYGIVGGAFVLALLEPKMVGFLSRRDLLTLWWSKPAWLRGGVYAGLVVFLTVFGGAAQKSVYFDF